MPKELSKARAKEPYTGMGKMATIFTSMGKIFHSPPKRRDPKKSKNLVAPAGYKERQEALKKRLDSLLKETNTQPITIADAEEAEEGASPDDMVIDNTDESMVLVDTMGEDREPRDSAEDAEDKDINIETLPEPKALDSELHNGDVNTKPSKKSKDNLPNDEQKVLYDRWMAVLPDLVDPLISYVESTIGVPVQPLKLNADKELRSSCPNIHKQCEAKKNKILCLFYDHFTEINVVSCQCQGLLSVLVANGLFPTSPLRPRMALSVDLLDFYNALFERSCEAVNALASALNTLYNKRGYILLDTKGEPVEDGFRRGLGYAIQWYDGLLRLVRTNIDGAVNIIETVNPREEAESQTVLSSQDNNCPPSQLKERKECAEILQERCPACFAGTKFGRSWDEGGDIHISIDGNFNHRHLKSAGDCPPFYSPDYFLSKEQVDAVGERIELVRKKKPHKKRKSSSKQTPDVPDEAIDECENGHTAGNGSNVKTPMDKFDAGGLMGGCCRHDVPLFLANIDTPGEQQKYSVAIIEHIFTLIPSNANLVVLYDVGCVLDRSLQLYDIMPSATYDRCLFATSAMHSYAHQWACQLAYSPRLTQGLGLSDGEGMERMWSRLCKLIGITRYSAKSKRIWLLDRHAFLIGAELRDDLGKWIKRRFDKGIVAHENEAKKILAECGIPVDELREQWALQKQSQLSIKAHAPAKLKKEIDALLNLQSDLENLERTIKAAVAPKSQIKHETEIERQYQKTKAEADRLYSSLEVPELPELNGVDPEFIKLLILARTLKINIRKRAIGNFFEWDKLDRASGGKDIALGTSLHQITKKAIQNRTGPLMSSIKRFNSYCAELAKMYNPAWSIPLPDSLPVSLSLLKKDPLLMQDIWIGKSFNEVPRWIKDPDVRDGIRAMLKIDRCLEERKRLGIEADNLCRWFGQKYLQLEIALCQETNLPIFNQIVQRRNKLLRLKSSWTNQFVPISRFDYHISHAKSVVSQAKNPTINPTPKLSYIYWQNIPKTSHESEIEIDDTQNNPTEIEGATLVELTNDTLLDDIVNEEGQGNDPEFKSWVISGINSSVPDPLFIEEMLSCIDKDNEDNLLTFLKKTVSEYVQILGGHFPRRVTFSGFQGKIISDFMHHDDLQRLKTSDAWLNDTCINAVAEIMRSLFAAAGRSVPGISGIFSTQDFSMVKYNIADEVFWRRVKHVMYWEKDLWIVPIHRATEHHWVLAIILPKKRQIFVFDSFAQIQPWKRDLKDIMKFIVRLVLVANKEGFPLEIIVEEGWTAQLLEKKRLQYNQHDCGLWILAVIGAVLAGHHSTSLEENDMLEFRRLIYSLCLALPKL